MLTIFGVSLKHWKAIITEGPFSCDLLNLVKITKYVSARNRGLSIITGGASMEVEGGTYASVEDGDASVEEDGVSGVPTGAPIVNEYASVKDGGTSLDDAGGTGACTFN